MTAASRRLQWSRITVDRNKCTGHAQCWATDHELFPTDDDGFVTIRDVVIDDSLRKRAEAGADACPEQAITLTIE